MSKPRGESQDSKPIMSVRVEEDVARELNEIVEQYDTRSEAYRTVVELGVEAHQYRRSPDELHERINNLEAELSRGVWERLTAPLRFMAAGGILTVLGLLPLVLGLMVEPILGYMLPPAADRILETGLLAAVAGVLVFLLGAVWVLIRGLRRAITPDV